LLTIGIRTYVPAEHAAARAAVLVAGPAPPAHSGGSLVALALIVIVVLLVATGKTIGVVITPLADLIRQLLQLVVFWAMLLGLTGLVLAALLLTHH
jgi:hypothetical protein